MSLWVCENEHFPFAQSDCFSAEGQDPPHNEYPVYDSKQSDGEVSASALGNREYPLTAIAPRSTLTQRGSTR